MSLFTSVCVLLCLGTVPSPGCLVEGLACSGGSAVVLIDMTRTSGASGFVVQEAAWILSLPLTPLLILPSLFPEVARSTRKAIITSFVLCVM